MRLDHLLSMENVSMVERHIGVFDGEILKERYAVVRFSGTEAEELKDLRKKKTREVGLTNAQGPPVPIPNTEVKLCSADNTLLATVREDRSRPTLSRASARERTTRGCSSAGRAPALQAGGHGFESHHLHQRAVRAPKSLG